MPDRKPPPRALVLALMLVLSLLGAAIGIQQVVTLGTAGHTGVLGAVLAMALGWLPGAAFARFRFPRLPALAQGAMLAATFGAGNALLLPIGIPAALGRPDLVAPLFLGVALALAADAMLAWRLLGTGAVPAAAPWPQGAAVGETVLAARDGERRGTALLLGMATGAFFAMYRVPMLAFGLAFLARPRMVAIFALGLLLRGHLGDLPAGWLPLPGGDLMRAQVPQGMMLGAGLAALCQLIARARRQPGLAATLGFGAAAHLAIAVLLALAGGLLSQLTPGTLLLFVSYAALAAFLHLLVSAIAAMHTGWFPGLAVAMVALAVGLALGFPPAALCLAVGFTAATGPGFIALGHAFKAGDLLDQGEGGRRELLLTGLIAFAVAGAAVWLAHGTLFAAQRVPPMDHVYAIAIRAGAVPGALERMALWALPGALLQFAGGPARQLGLLFATGLLLLNPAAGWALLAGLACRALFLRIAKGHQQEEMRAFAGGVIAGDALYALYDSAWRILGARR